jgi:outer membrane receptor protein involved in Fe transport
MEESNMKTTPVKWSSYTPLVGMLLFVLHSILLGGTTGKIAGKVTDAETGEPLLGVNVIIDGTDLGASTDAEGDYFIVRIPPGVYSVRASMMGYAALNQTEVRVEIDRSVELNFGLTPTILEGELITVEAQREVIKMDVSSSATRAQAEDIVSVPLVRDVTDFLNLTAGVQGMEVRGGGLDQTGFMLDGLDMVDNRSNRPVIAINLSTVQEVSVIKGGFNAEYGNIRSGLINVVTKEGSPSTYHAFVDLRMTPAHKKHNGPSILGPDNYWTRPFLDEDVCWVGTARGDWSREKKDQNQMFTGWEKQSNRLRDDEDPSNDKTPEELRDLFLWENALEGSGELGQRELQYAHRPDWQGEVSLSGPVPGIGRALGNLSFLASYRQQYEMFPVPRLYRSGYTEENAQLKLTSRISRSMKLNLDFIHGKILTAHRVSGGAEPNDDDWYRSGDEMLDNIGRGFVQQIPEMGMPFNVYRNMLGMTFDHVLSPKTFYAVRFSRVDIKNRLTSWSVADRDTVVGSNRGRYIGDEWIDERPWGQLRDVGILKTIGLGDFHSVLAYGFEDSSEVTTYNTRFDFTSQLNKHNQLKTGVSLTVDHLRTNMFLDFGPQMAGLAFAGNRRKSEHSPIRVGAYIQDQLEYEGMIANLGIRLDYSNPNTDWYDLDTYDNWFRKEYRDTFIDDAPKEPAAESKVKISPRLGMSHPIGEASKIFFNYGHFYSMPMSVDMYRVGSTEAWQGVTYLANPNLNPPRTIAYELGFEYNIANMFLVSLVGYYKDVTEQTGEVRYVGFDEGVDYTTVQNNHYADIRGFELSIEKRFGQWVTGWFNYNYMVETSGLLGFSEYYESPIRFAQMVDPHQERPLARPFARANIDLRTPVEFGPRIGGVKPLADWQLGWLVSWVSGEWISWNPNDPNSDEVQENLLQNVQTKAHWDVDLRLSKTIRVGGSNIRFFADVVNAFNIQNLNMDSFVDQYDYQDYMESLKLPMYDDPEYADWESGDDKVGDVSGKKKDHILMPDLDHLWFLNPRHIWFGLQFEF